MARRSRAGKKPPRSKAVDPDLARRQAIRAGIKSRKEEHVAIVVDEPVRVVYNHWDDITLVHQSFPATDMESVDLTTELLGKKLNAPIMISGMTGGYPGARRINENLAHAAAEVGVAMGVGSQRAALVHPEVADTFGIIGEYDVPLRLANIGAPQLVRQSTDKEPLGIDAARKAMEMVKAHALAIHLNFLQEVVQPEGDTRATGVAEAIAAIARQVPVYAKETGAGVSRRAAEILVNAGVKVIDVGGASGTSFSAVETYRARDHGDRVRARIGENFWSWGIPTPVAILEAQTGRVPVVGTGGVRNGLDVARALALGATAAGLARPMLLAAKESWQAAADELRMIMSELRAAVFLTGGRRATDLRAAGKVIQGPSLAWIQQRGWKAP